MDFKNSIEKIKNFTVKRLIEFIGIFLLILAFLVIISLISYNPNDPNYIYSQDIVIKNFLGINGSIGADFLLQSIGIVSYFLPISLIFLSISIIYQKKPNFNNKLSLLCGLLFNYRLSFFNTVL